MVVFDTSTLLLTLDPSARPPLDPSTGKPVERCKDRVDHLIVNLSKARTAILVPTPVIAEFLVKAGPNKQRYIEAFFASRHFEVGDFNARAAIECAHLLDGESNRVVDAGQTKAKVKFDRQIVAIAKAKGADRLFTDDEKLAAVARKNGMAATMTWEIPLPPEPPQMPLFGDTNSASGNW